MVGGGGRAYPLLLSGVVVIVVVVVVDQERLKHSKTSFGKLIFECRRSERWQRKPLRNVLMPFRAEFECTSKPTCNP